MQSKGKANSKADIQHDHLTALWNKEAGEELLDSCIRTAKAQSTSFLAVLLDVNDLDTINKRCGHQEGIGSCKGQRKNSQQSADRGFRNPSGR